MTELEFTGILEMHRQGYKGSGVTIVNFEDNTEHAEMTNSIIRQVAPQAKIINLTFHSRTNDYFYLKVDDVQYSPQEFLENFDFDIVSVSFSGQNDWIDEQIKPWIEAGKVVFCAAGNDGNDGVDGKFHKIGITVGACRINAYGDVVMQSYSGYDSDRFTVDMCGFCLDGSGTSAACPFVAASFALDFNKFGKSTQSQILNLSSDCFYDVDDNGIDVKSGKGIFMQDTATTVNHFKDVNNGRWSAEAIEYCRASGLMTGISENEFAPTKQVTREELAMVLFRLDNNRNI